MSSETEIRQAVNDWTARTRQTAEVTKGGDEIQVHGQDAHKSLVAALIEAGIEPLPNIID